MEARAPSIPGGSNLRGSRPARPKHRGSPPFAPRHWPCHEPAAAIHPVRASPERPPEGPGIERTRTRTRFPMTLQRLMITGALLTLAPILPACSYDDDLDTVGEAGEEIGSTGTDGLPPSAIDATPLKRAITNGFGITTSSTPDPIQLCVLGTITATGCSLRAEWESWLAGDPGPREAMMKGIAKCAVEPAFTIR